jgi:two-component system cell cycle sensor histidine kinase/response regulator CckA
VLLSSGYNIDGQAKEILQRGCNGFLQKPFTLGEVSRAVREVVES